MKAIDELIQTCDKLCSNIDSYIEHEKRLSIDLQIALDNYSLQIFKTKKGLSEIKSEMGV